MLNTCVYRAVKCPDLPDCFYSGHHGHLVVNYYNGDRVFFLLKLLEIFGAAVDHLLTMAYEMAIINEAHLLKHNSKGFNIVVHVVCADDAKFFAV